jgi:hypothetical protein
MISTTVPQTNKALKPSEYKSLKAEAGGDMMWVSYCSARWGTGSPPPCHRPTKLSNPLNKNIVKQRLVVM